MNEFYRWVVVVTLLIFLNLMTWMGILYIDKKLKQSDAIVQRAEKVDKKSKPKIEPESEKE